MSFSAQPAADFIPQRAPFILVDELIFVDGRTSRSRYKIPKENPFVKENVYSGSGMVESMAQTAAAGTGYLSSLENKPVPVGYLGAVQKLVVHEWPSVGDIITMEINLLTNILQVSLVSGNVKIGDRILASCEMKIFVNHKT